ncbi:hypothetical protein FQZ97_1018220 [compost metagenome]
MINHYFIRQKTGQVLKHLVFPLIGLVIIAYVLVSMSFEAQSLGIGWIAIGLVYLAVLNRRGNGAELAREI